MQLLIMIPNIAEELPNAIQKGTGKKTPGVATPVVQTTKHRSEKERR
jgi:hypothetical protein